ncbi:uncharacterized protein LOC100376177 [Saccoglossus kowalevskii]
MIRELVLLVIFNPLRMTTAVPSTTPPSATFPEFISGITFSQELVNFAYGKTATQVHIIGGGEPDQAVDGETGYLQDVSLGGCTSTKSKGATKWWKVEMEMDYIIRYVVVYNTEINNSVLNNAIVGVSRDDITYDTCDIITSDMVSTSRVIVMECDHVMVGRYVKVTINKEGTSLTLCEVEVYDKDPYSVTKYNDSNTVQCSDGSINCHLVTNAFTETSPTINTSSSDGDVTSSGKTLASDWVVVL